MTRRSTLGALWAAPWAGAAMLAPGAAASVGDAPHRETTPHPRLDGPVVGLILSDDAGGPGRFALTLRLVEDATVVDRGFFVLPSEVRVDIETEQDVAVWAPGIVADGPRAGHVRLPAGSVHQYRYDGRIPRPGRRAIDDSGRVFVEVLDVGGTRVSQLAASPRGAFGVTATVTRGPVYTGADPVVRSIVGEQSVFARVRN